MQVDVFDLRTFSKVEGADYQKTEATEIGWLRPIPLPEAKEFFGSRLLGAGWKELDQSVTQLDTDKSWLRVYTKDGFFLRLFLNELSTSTGYKSSVELLNAGNIDTRQLPMPADAKKTYEDVLFTAFETGGAVQGVIEQSQETFKELGWTERECQETPSGAMVTFVQNAIRLQVNIQKAETGSSVYYSVFALKADES